jgi:hypothetical protein
VKVPPTQNVTFDVVLLNIEPPPEPSTLLSLQQRITTSLLQKEMGNKAVSNHEYESAKIFYNKV